MTDLLTVPEAAAALRCHTETVLRAIRRGEIDATLFGGRYLIDPADLPTAPRARPLPPRRRPGKPAGPVSAAVRQMDAS